MTCYVGHSSASASLLNPHPPNSGRNQGPNCKACVNRVPRPSPSHSVKSRATMRLGGPLSLLSKCTVKLPSASPARAAAAV